MVPDGVDTVQETHVHPELTWTDRGKMLAVGTIQGFEMSCQNAALAFLPVSARTIAGSVGVLFMMASACLYGIERVDALRVLATLMIVSGGMLNGLSVENKSNDSADSAPVHAQFVGYLLVLTARLLSSQRWALVQVLLQDKRENAALPRMTKVQMLPYIMFANTVVCAVLSYNFE